MTQKDWQIEFNETLDAVSESLGADIFFLNGTIEWDWTPGTCITDICQSSKCRENLLMVLVTNGGDPDAAYRIARTFQREYKKFFVYIPGYCKSAGTLVAIGAHEIIIADHGELGPLDVQIRKRDELREYESGLAVTEALRSLSNETFTNFEKIFLELINRSGGQITLKTATQIATDMTIGLFRPIYAQIDPLKIGEIRRAMSIAEYYGRDLNNYSLNLKETALQKLIAYYPSHGYVIDREEARSLFINVREPSEHEKKLADLISNYTRIQTTDSIRTFISNPIKTEQMEQDETEDDRRSPEGEGQTPGTDNGHAREEIPDGSLPEERTELRAGTSASE